MLNVLSALQARIVMPMHYFGRSQSSARFITICPARWRCRLGPAAPSSHRPVGSPITAGSAQSSSFCRVLTASPLPLIANAIPCYPSSSISALVQPEIWGRPCFFIASPARGYHPACLCGISGCRGAGCARQSSADNELQEAFNAALKAATQRPGRCRAARSRDHPSAGPLQLRSRQGGGGLHARHSATRRRQAFVGLVIPKQHRPFWFVTITLYRQRPHQG